MLEKEQEKESGRDNILRDLADPQEKRRLDKIFGIERAQAQKAINDLQTKHEREQQQLKNKYK